MWKKDVLRINGKLAFAIKVSIIIAIWYLVIPDFPGVHPVTAFIRTLLAKIAVPTFIIAFLK